MKFKSIYLLILLLFVMTACTSNLNKDAGVVSKEEWCDRDEDMPWSGCWREIHRLDCETGAEFESDESIGELRLRSDGGFSITWHPFESYTDYAGTYKINVSDGSITFDQVDKLGYDGEGFFLIRDSGDLELIDLWFGHFYSEADSQSEVVACGYVFRSK